MKGWLLDTNVVSEPGRLRPEPRVETWLKVIPPERTYICVLTLAELEQGVEGLPITHPNRSHFAAFLARTEAAFAGRVLPFSNAAVRAWGVARGRRRLAGLGAASVLDSQLAAVAIHHRLHFATRNKKDVVGLGASVFNPWTDDPGAFPIEG